MTASKKKDEKKFEDLLSELESIVQELEGGQVGLDEALEKYEKGIAALKACYGRLAAAEKKIEILAKTSDGSLKTEPFEGEKEDKKPVVSKRSRIKPPVPSDKDAGDAESADEEKTLF